MAKKDETDIVKDNVLFEEPEAETPEIAAVRFTGGANRRILTTKDLSKLGIEDPLANLEWNSRNNFTIQAENIGSPEAVGAILALTGFAPA